MKYNVKINLPFVYTITAKSEFDAISKAEKRANEELPELIKNQSLEYQLSWINENLDQ